MVDNVIDCRCCRIRRACIAADCLCCASETEECLEREPTPFVRGIEYTDDEVRRLIKRLPGEDLDDWLATVEAAADAAGLKRCALCAHGGLWTLTPDVHTVPWDFLSVVPRRAVEGTCDCGARTRDDPACESCVKDITRMAREDGWCPACWSNGERARTKIDTAAVEDAGADDVRARVEENGAEWALGALKDAEAGRGGWDESAVNALTARQRCKLAGLTIYDEDVADHVWALIRRAWCTAYENGAMGELREQVRAL